MTSAIVILVSAALAALRVMGHKSQAFQAVAHLWVGGLLAHWSAVGGAVQLWMAIALSAIELACFLLMPREPKWTRQKWRSEV